MNINTKEIIKEFVNELFFKYSININNYSLEINDFGTHYEVIANTLLTDKRIFIRDIKIQDDKVNYFYISFR